MKLNHILLIIIALLTCSVSNLSQQNLYLTSWVPGNLPDMSDYEMQKFQEHVDERLPLYVVQFKKYADLYELPWALVAAVAYQESKWDNNAVSHTGVRGLMQLTQQTADHIGIVDRENAFQSIRGGAYYLKYLYNKTSPELNESQRWVHALAAYNIGWGHFRDAYRLSLRLNKDPLQWEDLKEVLPKLDDEKYSPYLRYGFARGHEAVDFVEGVLEYYILISRSTAQSQFIAGF